MNELRERKIALIGGAGFIGHNLALYLAGQGAFVEVIDSLEVNNFLAFASHYSSSTSNGLYLRMIQQRLDLLREAKIPIHPVDARDPHALEEIIRRINPQAVVHLAAVAHAGTSNKNPASTFDHSLRTLQNALESVRGKGIHFVYLSSSMVYGNFQSEEVSEDHPLNPVGIYGALKLAAEKIVIAYHQVFELPYTIVRPSALYGPRCVSRRVGQIFIESALVKAPLRVDGDGLEKLDFTYIEDLVTGIGLVLDHPAARQNTFNLTFGKSRAIRELLDIVKKEFPKAQIQHVERDKLMPFRGTLSVKKAVELLGYTPQYPIEIGFKKYIDWYRSFQ